MSDLRKVLLAACSVACMAMPARAAAPGAPLVDAAHRDNLNAVQALLKAHAPVNSQALDGATALAWAAANSDSAMVKLLLAAGADPDRTNDYGVTPLALAVMSANAPIAKALLEAHAKPDLALWTGETPLMFAARNGSVDIMKLLVQHGANVNARETRHGQTALMWAAAAGKTDAVRFLIASKANVKAQTPIVKVQIVSSGAPNGYTTTLPAQKGSLNALMFAASSSSSNNDVIEALIAAGTPVNAQAADGTTALIFSLYRHVNPLYLFPHDTEVVGDVSMAEDLIRHGADPNLGDAHGLTPLIAVVFSAFGHDMVGNSDALVPPPLRPHNADALAEAGMLLAHGADPNLRLKDYATPNSLGQDVRQPARFMNVSPLMLAGAFNRPALIKLMLDSGRFKVNQPRESGNTPLMDAVQINSLMTVEALVGAGADVNAVNVATGQTALHLAAEGDAGAGPIVRYLVDHGAKIDVRDAAGKTPVDMAKAPERLGNRSIYGGTVTDALVSVKDGKAVAPEGAVIDLIPPGDAYVTIRDLPSGGRRGGTPPETGRAAMVAIAAAATKTASAASVPTPSPQSSAAN